MDGMRWDDLTREERLIAEQAVLNFRELNRICDAAADGTVLDACETLAMQQGRALIRTSIETTLGHQAERVEKNGAATDLRLRTETAASGPQAARDHHGCRRQPFEGVISFAQGVVVSEVRRGCFSDL
jgi:hypothetical protein